MAESRSSSSSFEQWYVDCCRRHAVLPNKALTAAFFRADVKKSSNQLSCLVIFLDNLKDTDFPPLLEILMEIDNSEIDVVDILNVMSCDLNWEYVLLLLRAMNRKLRVVDLRDSSFGKEFLRDLSQRGLTSQVLNLKSSRFQNLDMVGNFKQLHILNLDFSTSLTSFHRDCFSCMPNLKCLSLCETRIANLWTTSSALLKLPSLEELRFQICLYCDNQEPATSGEKTADLGCLNSELYSGPFPFEQRYDGPLEVERAHIDDDVHVEDLSDDNHMCFTNSYRDLTVLEAFSDMTGWNGLTDLQNEISGGMLETLDEEMSSTSSKSRHISQVANEYISYHSSPICYERHYREYMIASLPSLKLLDNLPIHKVDREKANITFTENFEYLPYRRKNRESVTSILQKREIRCYCTLSKNRRRNLLHEPGKSQLFYSRSLSAAKVGSSAWPSLYPVSISGSIPGDGNRNFRARQFEYHPSDSSLMAFGTLDGEVIVINHENEELISYIPSLGAMNCVLGLCWLKNYPSKVWDLLAFSVEREL